MREIDHFLKSKCWLIDEILLRHDAPCYGPNGAKDAEIEDDRAILSNFKVKKQFRVQDGGDRQHRSQRSGNESNEFRDLYGLVFWELVDITAGKWI